MAGAEQPVRGTQLASDERRILKPSGAEGEVDAVFDQVELVVGEAQLDIGLRVQGQKVDHGADEEVTAKTNRGRNADRARRLRPRLRKTQVRLLDRPQPLAALLIVETPGIRQVEAACGALQQPHTDLTLERGDTAADGCLGHGQQASCSGEAAGFDDAGKYDDIVEIDHCIHYRDNISQL